MLTILKPLCVTGSFFYRLSGRILMELGMGRRYSILIEMEKYLQLKDTIVCISEM